MRLSSLSVKSPSAERTQYHPVHRLEESQYQFETINANFMQSKFMQRTLSDLKRLEIDVPQHCDCCNMRQFFSLLNCINHFQQLAQLQITDLRLCRPAVLRLPNLVHLSIQHVAGYRLKIDCPNLMAFETCNSLYKFEFVHPTSVKWYSAPVHESAVERFVNLNRYWCKSIAYMRTGALKRMPKLSVLYCRDDARFDLLRNLLSDRLKLRRLDFKVSYGGLQLKTVNDLEALPESRPGFLFDVDECFQIFLDNYWRLDDVLPHVRVIDYSRLMANERFKDGIDMDKFFKKFVCIERVKVDGKILDEKQFTEFIGRCDYLKSLELHFGELSQKFYDSLGNLSIEELTISERRTLNMSFLFRLGSATFFSLNQLPDSYQIWRIMDELPEMRTFCFMSEDKNFKLSTKRREERFELEVTKFKDGQMRSTVEKMSFESKDVLYDFFRLLIELIS